MTGEERELMEEMYKEEASQIIYTKNFVIEPIEVCQNKENPFEFQVKKYAFRTRDGEEFAQGAKYEIIHDSYIKVQKSKGHWALYNRHGEIEGQANNMAVIEMPNKYEYITQKSKTGKDTALKIHRTKAAYLKASVVISGLLALSFAACHYNNKNETSHAQLPATYLGTSNHFGLALFDTDGDKSTVEIVTIADKATAQKFDKQKGKTHNINDWAKQAGYPVSSFQFARQREN